MAGREMKKPPHLSMRGLSKMARRTGLEPATPGVTGRYSNQLNYRRALLAGAKAVGAGAHCKLSAGQVKPINDSPDPAAGACLLRRSSPVLPRLCQQTPASGPLLRLLQPAWLRPGRA